MKALILASGEGKRLIPLTEKTNKCMLLVNGKPIAEHIVENCAMYGIRDIVFAIGIKKEQIMEYFGDSKEYNLNGKKIKVKFFYADGNEIVQTAGEIFKAKSFLKDEEDFLLYYGDALTNLDIGNFYNFHKKMGGIITGPGMKEVYTESGIYVHLGEGKIKAFHEKPFINDLIELPGIFSNVPIYFINKKIWGNKNIVFGKDFNKDVLPDFMGKGEFKMFFQENLWHIDIGDLKKYVVACRAYESGTQEKIRKLA